MNLPVKNGGMSVEDRIILFKETESIELTEAEKQVMERADYADNLIRADLYQSDRDIAKRLHEKFGVSIRTGYKDIDRAKLIHGSTKRYEKSYWLSYLLENARRSVAMAIRSESVKHVIESIKVMGQIVAMLPDESKDPMDKLQPHNYFLVIKGETGSAIKIDLHQAEMMPPEQVIEIERAINDNFVAETIDILHEEVKSE